MKIYNKSAFISGLFFAVVFLLLLFRVLPGRAWAYVFSFLLSVRYLYTGLTHSGSAKAEKIAARYDGVATELFGKFHAAKTALPLIVAVGFLLFAAFLRFVFDIVLPTGIWVLFLIALTLAAAYSFGIQCKIEEHINEESEDEKLQ